MATTEPTRPERELQAYREIGITDIRPWLARLLMLGFIATICLVPLAQGVHRSGSPPASAVAAVEDVSPPSAVAGAPGGSGGLLARAAAVNRRLLDLIARCDDWARTRSVLATTLRPAVQLILTRGFGAGTEKVVVGRDGWLFYRPAVDSLTGPGFLPSSPTTARPPSLAATVDPVSTIVDLRDQLAAHGVALVLLPIPVKAAIHPEHLTRRAAHVSRPLTNPSFSSFAAALTAAGVTLLDPTPALLRLVETTGEPVFLATDTHWTPAAVEEIATELAALLRRTTVLPPPAAPPLGETAALVQAPGDLAAMLDLAPAGPGLASQQVTIRPVTGPDDAPLRPRPGAPVLLLGDSFANIYSRPELGWGATAGLGERLAFHLGWPIDAVTRNDDGAIATRRELARQLAADPGRLAGTRVVVWELTERELTGGDWRQVALPTVAAVAPAGASRFVRLAAGTAVMVTGTVVKAAATVDPREAPYADYVRALLLADVVCEPACEGDRALVFVSAMADRRLTFGARVHAGDRLRLRLTPWSTAPEQLRSASRGELLDADLLLETPLLGEEASP